MVDYSFEKMCANRCELRIQHQSNCGAYDRPEKSTDSV